MVPTIFMGLMKKAMKKVDSINPKECRKRAEFFSREKRSEYVERILREVVEERAYW